MVSAGQAGEDRKTQCKTHCAVLDRNGTDGTAGDENGDVCKGTRNRRQWAYMLNM